jgi:pyroglutamyl-peptidase
LDGRIFNNCHVKVEEVPLKFKETRGTIEALIERHIPAAVICTGQGGGSWLNLERVAINVADATKVSYNCGEKPSDATLIKGSPAAYFTRLPIRRLLHKIRVGSVPGDIELGRRLRVQPDILPPHGLYCIEETRHPYWIHPRSEATRTGHRE